MQKKRHRLDERGQEVGIERFNVDRVASNTLASHRIVQWVTRTLGINAAEDLYSDLNARHFVEGKNLNNREMLVDAAVRVGADPDNACAFLDSDEGNVQIERSQQRLGEVGISGIPTLILGGQLVMPSGALGSDVLVETFRKIEEKGGMHGALFAEDLSIPPHVLEETLVL